ncbi:MAG TPA: hypothetical protein VME41_07530 [Stellaceae bacterium]|nr:hypothetical protein [Stellaceae bacterium]
MADAAARPRPAIAPLAAPHRGAATALLQRLIPCWPLLAGLLFFARLLAARRALLNDPDTYLHVAAGRWMLAHAALPLHDPFSHSMPGALWICSEWLAEIALAASYRLCGWNGVVILAAGCAAAALALLAHFLLRRLPPLPALIATAAAAELLEPHVLARPHILALPLLVLWSGWLLAARDAARGPPFAALPVMALWSNLHASFLFGLALAAFLGGEAVLQPAQTRGAEAVRWGGFVAAAILAALLTPLGPATLVQPFRLMLMPSLQSGFGEWLSPNFQQSPDLELWILGIVFVGFATGLRLPPTRLVLLLGLMHEMLQHVRHADLLAIVGPLAIAAPLGRRLGELTPSSPSRLAAWCDRLARPASLPAGALALVVAAALAAPAALRPLARGDDAATPAAALAAAQSIGLTGPVLNSEAFGGYLLFRGVPDFIDGRIELYGNAFLAADLAAERGDRTALAGLLRRYHIAWTLLQRHSAEALAMRDIAGWRRVYADDRAIVYRRADGAPR